MPLPKKPLQSIDRQPQGVPVGGQFAATTHSEPDVTLTAGTPVLGGSGGDGGLPPIGGSGRPGDDEERTASQNIVFTAASKHKQLRLARTISLSSDHRGNLRVDDVAGPDGKSIQLDYRNAPLAGSLQLEINANVPGGRGLPAHHIIGDQKSVSIDAPALLKNEIKIVGLGKRQP
ncbi:hypothetical protein [Arthrobacter sp. UYCo732]|uniref:hypothetical protein n=1 Tax=Arthrobacter sp. UYCo732 TaxID=3156336 RepID=UPI00339A3EE9